MPLSDRDYIRGRHPSACTCVDCVNKRLGIIIHQKHSSLYHPTNKQRQRSYKRDMRHGTPKQHPHSIPKPLKLLSKLGLNLLVFATLGLLIWSSIKAFSHQWALAIGYAVVIGTLTLFILLCTQLSKWKYRKPSMKLTVFSLICLFLIFSFAGVQPMASYKDEAIGKVTTFFNEQKEKGSVKLEQNNSEQEVINKENNEPNEDSLLSKSIDVADDLWDTSVDDYANKFNQYRQSKGLTSLVFVDDLNRVAGLRLKELYTNFSHYSAGKNNEHLAENIVMSTGFLSNSDALVMWQNSPGHNANMLNYEYKYTGYAAGNGYAIQLFTSYPTRNGQPQLPSGWYWND